MMKELQESQLKLDDLIDRKELAKMFGVSEPTVRRWQARGLPYVRLGVKVFFFEQDVVNWMGALRRVEEAT